MGLVAALSNPETQALFRRLTKRDWPQVQREQAKRSDRARDGKLKYGSVSGAILTVLAQANAPMRYIEIHQQVEALLGTSVCRSSVKQVLSAEASHKQPRFERLRRGCYTLRPFEERRPP